jgi:hypothetical protein
MAFMVLRKKWVKSRSFHAADKLLWKAVDESIALRRVCAHYSEFRFIHACVSELQIAVSHENTGHAYKEFV